MTEHSCYYALYGDLILEVPHYLEQAVFNPGDWKITYRIANVGEE